jgi:hypothetical protein
MDNNKIRFESMRNEIGKVNKLIEKRRIGKGFVIR